MRILAIDYGRKKIGIATATTMLAEVYGVIRSESVEEAIKKLRNVVEKESINKIVVGVSEGKMAEETKAFAKRLKKVLKLSVTLQDETLSTKLAQSLSINAGIKRKKRKEFEDAYSAAIILQDYLNLRGKI